MANEKRQRQDQRRADKLKELEAQAAKVEKNQKLKKALWIGIPALAVLAGVLFWPRGSSSDSTASETTVPATVAETTLPPTTLPAAISKAPDVVVPDGEPPKTLQIKDLVVGTGPEAVKGSRIEVNYVGKSWSTKKKFDASWDRNQTFTVASLGNGGVIDGWGEGLIGIKEGGRRQLIIPADKAYGDVGSGPDIKAGETLVFVVDAVKVTPPAS